MHSVHMPIRHKNIESFQRLTAVWVNVMSLEGATPVNIFISYEQ